MYENDTLLKFILIHRIESIQDDAYTHGSSLINKYEVSALKYQTSRHVVFVLGSGKVN